MGAWSGYQVTIGKDPDIEIWPDFRAILTDVTLKPTGATDDAPVVEAERVEVELSAIAALGGNVVFSSARLIRPTLHVEALSSGFYLPRMPGSGRLTESIDAARRIVAEDRTNPQLSRFPTDAFGSIEFTDGRVVTGSGSTEMEIVTDLAGSASLPTLDGPGWLTAAGVWRGEATTLELSSARPLLLLAGGTAPLSLSAKSAPANFEFSGNASLMENLFVDGRAKFSTPSLRRMLEWSHARTAAGTAIGSIALDGQVEGNSQRIKIESAEIVLDGSPGSGLLDLLLSGPLPVISGTLAFERLDLRSFLSAFTPLEQTQGQGPIDASFADRVNLDLRLSAQEATVGSIKLAEVAATARVKDGLAAFDVSDATAFGGTIQSGLRVDRTQAGTELELRLLASDVDGAALAAAAGMTRMAPSGRGKVSVILKGPGNAWETMFDRANGSVSANFGPGSLTGIDLPGFLDRSQKDGFFPLDAVAEGTLETTGIDLKANVSNGVAIIDKGEVRSERYRVQLSGIMPFAGKGLALSGSIWPSAQPAAGTKQTATAEFFVGGSWNAPFVSPVPKDSP